ncbi:HMA5 [Symbiodinium sp. CCMP2592]|nr:HMA5 [Symbiodinium sp. CCMP2592]
MAALLGDAGFSAGLAAVPRRPQRNARTGDKNNIYIIGHAAFGQGLMQLESCPPSSLMPIDPASSDEEEESESSSSESESETDSSSDHLPERPRRIGANEAAAKAFFKAKSCSNEGAGVGATFAPAGPARKTSSGSGSDGGSKPRRRRPPKGFADDGEPAPPPEQEDRMGVWPPVPTVDIFAEALTDALILRVTRATEEETPPQTMCAQWLVCDPVMSKLFLFSPIQTLMFKCVVLVSLATGC